MCSRSRKTAGPDGVEVEPAEFLQGRAGEDPRTLGAPRCQPKSVWAELQTIGSRFARAQGSAACQVEDGDSAIVDGRDLTLVAVETDGTAGNRKAGGAT